MQLYSPAFLRDREKEGITLSGYPWESVHSLFHELGIIQLIHESANNYLLENNISPLFVDEAVHAVTRANYAQDIKQIHALAGLVAMSASGSQSIQGGNARLFERMLNASGAELRTGMEGDVTGLLKMSLRPSEARWMVGTRDGHSDLYDAIVIATPWHNADITLLNTDRRVPTHRYQRLYVTVVATTAARPSSKYFHSKAPSQTILTTTDPVTQEPEVRQ